MKQNRKLEKEVRKLVIEHKAEIKMCDGKPHFPVCHGDATAHLEAAHFTEPKPITCKWCGSTDIWKIGIRNGIQNYRCRKCRRTFIAKNAPYHMQSTIDQIGASLTMYYNGLSLSKITQYLKEAHNNPANPSTVYRWLLKYTQEAVDIFEPYHPIVSDTWVADETVIKFNQKKYWLWDIIDGGDSRFLIASYLSPNRGTREARHLMELAFNRAGGKVPKRVITDKLAGYLDGIELAFGADTKHIQSGPFAEADDTNLIERMQGTIKDRTKVVRGFKTVPTAKLILGGFLIHYNFFRPHLSLKELPPKGIDKTPAEVAKIKAPVHNWTEVVKYE